MQVVHRFTSPKPDGPDATLVKPSNWNDQHSISLQIDIISGAAAISLADDLVRLEAGTYSVTVPLATGSGKPIYVCQDGAGTITLAPTGADTIGGQASVSLRAIGTSFILVDEAAGIWGLYASYPNNPGATGGTNLGDSSPTINPGSDNASFYTMPVGTMTANRTITLGVTGTLYAGASTVWILRRDLTAHTLTISNGGTNGTAVPSIVLPTSPPGPMMVGATYDGSDWYIHTMMYVQ